MKAKLLILFVALTVGYSARVIEDALSSAPFNPVAFAVDRYNAARAWVESMLAPPPVAGTGLFTGSSNFLLMPTQTNFANVTLYDGSPTLITVYGSSGTAVATVYRDGRVDLAGNPNEAARTFWQAVGSVAKE